jgi:NhaP-type Na+/H+ or K+/H+ antiporter
MNSYVVLIAVFGAIILITAWLPLVLKKLPLSLPIACIGVGVLLALSPLSYIAAANPLENRLLTERLTEFTVLVSLMGAGLKLDRPPSLRGWMVTWRLLAISMPLTIAGIALLGWEFLGLGVASAILLGAALAPTDPVLASDVQVGPPNSEREDDVRFSLTSEAGLNDALSFPFVYLAIAVALSHASGEPWLGDWLVVAVVWKFVAGFALGWLSGKLLGHLTFRVSKGARLSKTQDGLVAIGITCLTYGLTELAHGYGFLAVFVAAVTLRNTERRHSYHAELHDFTEQIERLFMMVILVCFGAAIAEGTIFQALNWHIVFVAFAIILILRPLAGFIGLAGSPHPIEEKAAIAFFGIRGLGSFYYLAYALGQVTFDKAETLWVTVSLVVLISVLLHGIAVTPALQFIDRRRRTFKKSPRNVAPH